MPWPAHLRCDGFEFPFPGSTETDPAVVYATALESGEPAVGGGACRGHVPLDEVVAATGR